MAPIKKEHQDRATPSPSKTAAVGKTSSPASSTKVGTWSAQDKTDLFDHVLKQGETKWGEAVPGKSYKQSIDQWK